jgi:hypothetical protein
VLPEVRFIETEPLRQVLGRAELPLARDAGGVAGLLQQMGERGDLRIDQPKLDVIAHIVDRGHQLDPGRCTQGRGVGMLETQAGRGEPVQVRRLIRLPAVGRDAFIAEIVGHDQDDIGLSGRGSLEQARTAGEYCQGNEQAAGIRDAGVHK